MKKKKLSIEQEIHGIWRKKKFNEAQKKQRIGKLIGQKIKTGKNINEVAYYSHVASLETNISIQNTGISHYQLKNFKKNLYADLKAKKKKLNINAKIKKLEKTKQNFRLDKNEFLISEYFDKKYKTKFAVFQLQIIKGGVERVEWFATETQKYSVDDSFFKADVIPNTIKTKEALNKWIIAQIENYTGAGYGKGKTKVRLIDITFRLFEYNNVKKQLTKKLLKNANFALKQGKRQKSKK
jgi:hypothetical protein